MNLKTSVYSLVTVVAMLTIQSCATPYYGNTKQEWDNLTEAEKLELKKDYQTVINPKNEQAHTDKINARRESIIDYGAGL